MALTVSIVTYNTSLDELRRCTACLDKFRLCTLYIVDNSERDYIRKFCQQKGYEYIALPNPGYGAAHNEAIKLALASNTTYHLVLNSDISFQPEILGKAIEYMDCHPEIGALHPLVYNPDGSRQYTARMLPTPFDVFARRFLPHKWIERHDRQYTLQDLPTDKAQNVPYFQGSFMLLRLSAIQEVGMFDTRFFMYPEDIDLIRRIHEKYQTVMWPEIKIIHDHRASSYHSMRMTWIHAINMCKYFNKWGWWRDSRRRLINNELRKNMS